MTIAIGRISLRMAIRLNYLHPEEGVASLCNLFRDYDFPSEGDMGCAISFCCITPALAQGGFLGEGRTPFFLVEKNTNNAGGSLMIKIICAIYGLKAKPINRVDNPDKTHMSRF